MRTDQIKDQSVMPTMRIDDIEVEVGRKDNVIQAARKAGVEIPHYCWHPDLSVVASCRMCLVEVGDLRPNGDVVMGPKLVPACQTPAKENMVVKTQSPKVKQSQSQTLEYLLLNHPLDCSICDQAGECYLQDYTYKFGNAHSRLQEPKLQRIDKYHIGDQIALFTDRCVMCTRCVRFTREVSGTAELQVINRGSGEEIDIFPGHPCNNKLAGNVVDICPVGALCSKDFLYKKRVWWLKSQESVCTGCSTGCSIHVDQSEDHVYRLRPRENPLAQGRFMCDEGRFGFHYIHDSNRLAAPRVGKSSINGQPTPATQTAIGSDPWPSAIHVVRQMFQRIEKRNLVILSPFMTCEEAYLLASWMKSLPSPARLLMGPVPVVGVDDHYPKGTNGESPSPRSAKFTIRAEKAPNRVGVTIVLKHFEGELLPWESTIAELIKGEFQQVYLVGGAPGYLDSLGIEISECVEFLVVQDILPSTSSIQADVVLASASFAEREGTIVNHASLAQGLKPAIRPPGEARQDGRLLMQLSGRTGLFHSASLRDEMADLIPAFSRWKNQSLEPHGILLEKKTLTATVVDVARVPGGQASGKGEPS